MTVQGRITGETEQPAEREVLDPVLQQTLRDFRASVHAWSEAVYQSPRNVHEVVVHRTWRLAAGWALALVLLAAPLREVSTSAIISRSWPGLRPRKQHNSSANSRPACTRGGRSAGQGGQRRSARSSKRHGAAGFIDDG